MESITDEELMKRTANGDDHAFAEIVRRHQNLVYGTVTKFLGHYHHDAEDISQQVFLRVYKAAPKYEPSAKFTTWLYTICKNCVFTEYQKNKRRQTVDLTYKDDEGEEHHILDQMTDTQTSNAREEVLRSEMEAALNKAMEGLPETQRMALILRQYEQLDYEEIAKVLKTTVPSVKSLLFRARDSLREALQIYLKKTD